MTRLLARSGVRGALAAALAVAVVATTPTAWGKEKGKGAADGADVPAQGPLPREARGLAPVEQRAIVPDAEHVVRGGTVLTADGHRYERGYVHVKDGRIVAVGEGDGPDLAHVVDATGKFVTPGLIDTHSHLGVYPSPGVKAHGDGNEAVAPTTPGVWAEHGAWPEDPGFERAVAGGITTLQLLPGSANLIGGRGVILRPLPARGARAMRFPGAPETLKMACGENPKRVYGERGGPQTRMGNVHGDREAFLAAERYLKQIRDARDSGDADDLPDQALDLDTLAGLLDGKVLAHVHCYRADDMVAFLQMADEFGFKIRSFHHAVEAYKIRDLLAARDVGVSTWSDWGGFKLEAYDAVLTNLAMVSAAGGRAIVHSDSEIGIQRLNQEAGKGWYDGTEADFVVSEDEALRWITLNPAWALGLDGETGSLTPGKRADYVLWSRHPFSFQAVAEGVWIDGARVWDASRPALWSDFVRGQEVAR